MGEIKAKMTAESRLGSIVVHAYNPSTWEIQDQPELCLKKAKTTKKDQVSRNIFLKKINTQIKTKPDQASKTT